MSLDEIVQMVARTYGVTVSALQSDRSRIGARRRHVGITVANRVGAGNSKAILRAFGIARADRSTEIILRIETEMTSNEGLRWLVRHLEEQAKENADALFA